MRLKILFAALLCSICLWAADVTYDFSQQGFSNQQAVWKGTIDASNSTIWEATGNSNTPTYYTTGAALRIYGGCSFIVSSNKPMEKIELTLEIKDKATNFDQDATQNIHGSKSFTWTYSASSGHVRVQKIAITYMPADALLGACGPNLYWDYDAQSKTLTITGEGEMKSCPWSSRDDIIIGSISLPEGLTSILSNAFNNCADLTSITIPSTVTSVGRSVFYGCTNLKSITWNVKNLDNSNLWTDHPFDFGLQEQITSFTFGNEVEIIPDFLCAYMNKLTSITIPVSVTEIGEHAFIECSSIKQVTWNARNCESMPLTEEQKSQITSFTFGNSVELIPDECCSDMTKLTSISIPNSVTSIGASAFYGCSSLGSVTIPNSVTNIGTGAFYGCSSLTSVTIPNSVTSIGGNAFNGCKNLTTIVWNAKNVSGYGYNWDFDETLYSFYGVRDQITSITFGKEVEEIPAELCWKFDKLTSIIIPDNVKKVNYHAFAYCSGLKSVTIGSGITYMDGAFDYCTSLRSITCKAVNPPDVGDESFYKVDKSIPLYVPTASINAYKAAKEWKEFYNIQSIDAQQGIEDIEAPCTTTTKVYLDGQVFIQKGEKTYTVTGLEVK